MRSPKTLLPLLIPLPLAPLLLSFQGPMEDASSAGRAALASSIDVAASAPQEEDAFDVLLARFEVAEKAHARALREAPDRAARKEIRSRRVEAKFWPEFEALAKNGSGRALLWMAQHVSRAGLGAGEAKARRPEILRELVDRYAARPWFADALEDLGKARRDLGSDWVRGSFRHVAEVNTANAVRAKALAALAKDLMRRDGDEDAAHRILERLAKDFADTKAGRDAAKRLFELEHLVVGKIAPDFSASTIDGYDFKLSDFKGKAVLLDFYGFW